MKCLIVTPWCDDLVLKSVRGTPENAYLVRELTRRGIDINILCPLTPGFPEIRTGRFSFVHEYLYDRKIYGLIKEMDYDFAISITGLGAGALKKTGKPFFNKYLGAFDFFLISGLKRKLYHRRFFLSTKTKPQGIVMTDDGTQGERAIREAGYTKEVLFLKNGYFPDLLNLKKENKEDTVINIGFAGSLELIKGVDFLFKIIKILLGGNKYKFIVAGDGSFRHKIEELATERPDKILYLGYLPYLKMPEFYKKIDILLSLNRYSNGTLPVVEAQAAGIPVVAYNVQETSKFIKHNETGFLVEPFDINSIIFLLKNIRKKQLLGMRENVKRFALKTFSDMEKRAEEEVDFYLRRLKQ